MPTSPRPTSRARARNVALASLVPLTTACSPSPSPIDDSPLAVPFTVSEHFAPSGFMGDGQTVGAVEVEKGACPTRAPGATGDCYRVTYTPKTWAGVYWQYPANNWGAKPGRKVLPGAKRATFFARGERGGERLEFRAGGIRDEEQPYRDTLRAESAATLTTEWQPLSVGFGTRTYEAVIGGFAWVSRPTPEEAAGGPIVFYLDAIRWEP